METKHFIVIDFKNNVVAVALNEEELIEKLIMLTGSNNVVIEMESKHSMRTMVYNEIGRKYATDFLK